MMEIYVTISELILICCFNYFLSIAKKITQNIKYNIIDSESNLMLYIFLSFKNRFPQIKFS